MSDPHLIGNRYELGELLGRGGMAEVRKGLDTRLGRTVAIKRLRSDLAADATFQARFRREAQSAASLNHPAVVAVYDTGEEWSSGTAGESVSQPYIVMEYVAGRTLRDILREGRKILPERALEITSGVLAALDYSHRAGIIHRDIKPGNVMLTPQGDVKVMDFGIARAISDASSSMTQTAAVVGTAQYLSPEQARGEQVDSRSDVYSTGCLLYELLTGRPPFVGDSPVAVAYQHVREPASPPSDHDTEIDPEIDAIVMKALAKRVDERYQSAAAMRADIEAYLAGRPVSAPPVDHTATAVVPLPVPLAPTAVPAMAPTPVAAEEEYQDRGTSTGLLIFLGVLLLALIAGAAYLLPHFFAKAPDQVQVPNVVNRTEAQARSTILGANLTVGQVTYQASPDVTADKVLQQDPGGRAYVDPGTAVNLVISSGKPLVTVPYVQGQTLDQAVQALRSQQLQPVPVSQKSDEPKNTVISTSPVAGKQVQVGSPVKVFYSEGPQTVPDVVGKDEQLAKQLIRQAGFVPKVVTSTEPTQKPYGTVVAQYPSGGQTRDQGTEVVLQVTRYVEPTQAPSSSTTPSPPATTSPSPTVSPTGTTTP